MKNALPRWQPPRIVRPKLLPRSILGPLHEEIGVARWGAFGSCTMPIQYGGGRGAIAEEHTATRRAAALYDVSHMLGITVRGRDAEGFLELVCGNRIGGMKPGSSKYSCISMPDGAPLDDLYVYCLEHNETTGEDVFLVVANSGHEADYYLMKAVAEGAVMIDPENPERRFEGDVDFASRLEEPSWGGRWSAPLFSVALQGPKSLEILLEAVSVEEKARIEGLVFNGLVTSVGMDGVEAAFVSRTGYCGEALGFEIYATAENLPAIWTSLFGRGAVPAGLGARDSTRQEAGLPLFGHEIDGALDIPFSGGRYKRLVDFRKPFFLGREGALERERARTHRVFLLEAEGPRKVSEGWGVYTEEGRLLGHVTSTSTIRPGRTDVAHAYLEESETAEGMSVIVASARKVPVGRGKVEGRRFRVVHSAVG